MKSIKRCLLAISGLLLSFGTFAGVSFDKKAIVTNAGSDTLLTTEQVKYKEENFVTPSVGWTKYGKDNTVLFESGDILFFSDPIARSSNGLFESFLTYDPEFVGDFGNCEQDVDGFGHLILLETNGSANISDGNWIAPNWFYSSCYGGTCTSTQRINKGNFIFSVGECYDASDLNGWEFYELNTGLKLKVTNTMPNGFVGKYNPADFGVCFLLQINFGWGQFIHYRNGFYCFENCAFDGYSEEELTFVGDAEEVYILPLSIAEEYVQCWGYEPIELLVYRENTQSKTLDSISASLTDTSKTLYGGDTLNASDITVTPTYSDGDGTPITDGTGVTLNGASSVTLQDGNNAITVSYTDGDGLGPVTTTLNVNAERKLTAEELASEFNDAMELNCDEHGNTSSTNLESIKTAWENAASQYKTLDTTEINKFNLVEGYEPRYKLTYSFDNDESNQEIKLIESQEYLGDGYDFDFCYLNSIEKNNLTIAENYISLKDNNSSFKINFNSQYMGLLINEIGVNISSTGSGGSGGTTSVTMFLEFYGKNQDNDEVGYFSNIPFSTTLKGGTSNYLFPPNPLQQHYDIYELKSLELKCTRGNPKIKQIFFTANFHIPNIGKMIEKYDYIYTKYGTSLELDNFLNRQITPNSSRKKLLNIKDVNDSTWIISVVSLIGLTSVGAYFFYRKRKEE